VCFVLFVQREADIAAIYAMVEACKLKRDGLAIDFGLRIRSPEACSKAVLAANKLGRTALAQALDNHLKVLRAAQDVTVTQAAEGEGEDEYEEEYDPGDHTGRTSNHDREQSARYSGVGKHSDKRRGASDQEASEPFVKRLYDRNSTEAAEWTSPQTDTRTLHDEYTDDVGEGESGRAVYSLFSKSKPPADGYSRSSLGGKSADTPYSDLQSQTHHNIFPLRSTPIVRGPSKSTALPNPFQKNSPLSPDKKRKSLQDALRPLGMGSPSPKRPALSVRVALQLINCWILIPLTVSLLTFLSI